MRFAWKAPNLLLWIVGYFCLIVAVRLVLERVEQVAFIGSYDFLCLTWLGLPVIGALSLLTLRRPIRLEALTLTGVIVRFVLVGLMAGCIGSVLYWAAYFGAWAGTFRPEIIGFGFVGAARSASTVMPIIAIVSIAQAGLAMAMVLKRSRSLVSEPS